MCGIAGIISANHRRLIKPMTEALVHRGPDGEGYFEDSAIALGHRRLSIIDLATGQQPIANETNSLQLVCNGEIYNSPELRVELERKGHVFKTSTDVEVILHLYEEYGRECPKYLRGMFAFALWDVDKQSLFMARDHLGQKPLFYYHKDNEFLFASEVKSILASGLIDPKPQLNALWHYVSLRFIPDDSSLFESIMKLPAATWLHWERGKLTHARYWEPSFKDKLKLDEAQVEEGLDELLRDTVKMHLLSDVRVGALLSGGIDSSTIAAMMAGFTDGPVPSFSIGVAEQKFNELPYARMVVDRYGLEAHEKVVKADLIHLIPKMIYHMDEPSDPFGVGVYLVSGVASQTVKVVLGGDGGDENFAGYDRFAGQKLADYYSYLPHWFRKQIMQRLVDRIPDSFGYKSLAQKAKWMNEMSFYTRGQRYARSMSFLRFTQDAKGDLFTAHARQQIDDEDSVAKILVHFDAENVDDLVDRMLYTDLMTRIPDHLLAIVDRMAMAHSLESRSPLLDYKLVEYAASIPGNMKLKGTRLKHILRRVASRYLPRELVYRPKQGFGFPMALWMRNDLSQFLTNLFKESRFVQLGIFNADAVQRILNEHLSGKVDHNFRLWILMNLELWYQINFENTSMDDMQEQTHRLMASANA